MRQYVAPENINSKGLLEVTGKDYRYFRSILRLCTGDMINVRLPSGVLQNMTVCSVDEKKRSIVLQVCDCIGGEPLSGGNIQNGTEEKKYFDLWLFQFISKSAKMDLIVRQATECGVSTIVPVVGAYCQAGNTEKNFRGERMERIIREARQQSGSPVPTCVLDAVSVPQAVELWNSHVSESLKLIDSSECEKDSLGIVLYERNEKTLPIHIAVGQKKELKCASVVCGAEGGISPAEIEIFETGGFVPVHFDTNILRCETAALYGIAALQTAITEKKIWQYRE